MMPTISVFYGIFIRMFWDEHAPPHFHASYSDFTASIDIKQIKMTKGDLPKRALKLVLEWTKLHQEELMIDWELCQNEKAPKKILPLP